MNIEEKQQALTACRRGALAAMETGQHERARTILTELAEFDLSASRALRADIVKSYGIDI
ncbi:hypothetical protein HOR51_gp33 [Ralstonia phage phiAp1]|uniref:Uncharacterized protein n=1 Tax=Ralstonia phage phiAp1 TaxID=2783867 RepID=A0A1L7DS76_9CAUD|nr:hypothetical protein HOR51_gp33 [Ralstonia phage phiAp1]APU03174.1 hypothetical protein phiAp1_33 [Ralstonia phage phiAp1]